MQSSVRKLRAYGEGVRYFFAMGGNLHPEYLGGLMTKEFGGPRGCGKAAVQFVVCQALLARLGVMWCMAFGVKDSLLSSPPRQDPDPLGMARVWHLFFSFLPGKSERRRAKRRYII